MTDRCRLAGLLTPYQGEVLRTLYELRLQMGPTRYWRPRELGAWRSSHHSHTLSRLADKGWVERAPLSDAAESRAYGYRITDIGCQVWTAFVDATRTPVEAVLGTEHARMRARRAAQLAA